jgi:hypothetical protein
MEEEETRSSQRALDEYSINSIKELEVKRRKCEEDLDDIFRYSWGYRLSKKLKFDIYKVGFYLFITGIILVVISVILMFSNGPNQNNTTTNYWFFALFIIGILFFTTSLLLFQDPAVPYRRKLAHLEQMIRIINDVEQGDDFTLDEDVHNEYKESFKYDKKTGQASTDLMKEVAITVYGFLNAEGGRVVIGIKDNKEIVGIENDLKLFSGSWDKFRLAIQDALRNYCDCVITESIPTIRKIEKGGKILCIIQVKPHQKQVFYKNGNNLEFYVREGNQTIKYDAKKTVDYISSHWSDNNKKK